VLGNRYISTGLSTFALICWAAPSMYIFICPHNHANINPDSKVVNNLLGVTTGLGYLPTRFDNETTEIAWKTIQHRTELFRSYACFELELFFLLLFFSGRNIPIGISFRQLISPFTCGPWNKGCKPKLWAKYNYASAALDSCVAVSAIVICFALVFPGVSFSWNNVNSGTVGSKGTPWKELAVNETIGETLHGHSKVNNPSAFLTSSWVFSFPGQPPIMRCMFLVSTNSCSM